MLWLNYGKPDSHTNIIDAIVKYSLWLTECVYLCVCVRVSVVRNFSATVNTPLPPIHTHHSPLKWLTGKWASTKYLRHVTKSCVFFLLFFHRNFLFFLNNCMLKCNESKPFSWITAKMSIIFEFFFFYFLLWYLMYAV